jgi:hypothetical protein
MRALTEAHQVPQRASSHPWATASRLQPPAAPSWAHGNPGGRPTHILLCNQSTIDIIRNPDLLTSIQTSSQPTTVEGLGGAVSAHVVETVGHLKNYGWVWHDPGGFVNILALPRVREIYRVAYDSGPRDDRDMFVVYTMRAPLRFGASSEGSYYATAASLAALSLTPVPSQGQPLVVSTHMTATHTQTEARTACLAAFHWHTDEG